MSGIIYGAIVPGLPQPLLCPEKNEGWQAIADGFADVRREIDALDPDVLVVYSTMWPSILGHQVQAQPEPEWVHVDELFHDLGSIPYKFQSDVDLANGIVDAGTARNIKVRTTAYYGFPIDTGSVVALKLLNPDNKRKVVILSSNVYSDRSETVVFAKSVADALKAQGKTAAAIVVSTLSNRLHTRFIEPHEDAIHSAKDDEWNRKLLEFLADGRLEDTAQLSRSIQKQIRVHKVVNFKPMWWLSGAMGQNNAYAGKVHAYAPLYGTGGAVVSLTPAAAGVGDKEYDESDVEVYGGERHVLGGLENPVQAPPEKPAAKVEAPAEPSVERIARAGADIVDVAPDGEPDSALRTDTAPKPVGPYPHARRVGDFLFLSGVGPRQPGTDAIPGGPIRDLDGNPLDYDVYAQTEAVIENIRKILASSGAGMDKILDVQVFLVDMDRDFKRFNEAYTKHFAGIGATRTTIAVRALPTPIAVEMKVIASGV